VLVLQLWQTRLLRFSKLTVANEVDNALSYYESTFLREIPKIYAHLEQALPGQPIANFLRMGQWIGGDRDGNPFVNADTLTHALTRQADVALRHYLTEVHYLGSELSLSAMLVGFPDELQTLVDQSTDTSVHRTDEPYRRALIGIYSRLAATLKALTGGDAARHAVPPHDPYPDAAALLADLQAIEASLLAHRVHVLATPRLRPLIRAVKVFGFHLATVDLRQSSDQHEAVLTELLAVARVNPNYAALEESAKCELLMGLLNDARPLRVMAASYSAHTLSEIGIFEAAKTMRERFGKQAIRHYIISHTETVNAVAQTSMANKMSCWDTLTATRTVAYSPATGSFTRRKLPWWTCLTRSTGRTRPLPTRTLFSCACSMAVAARSDAAAVPALRPSWRNPLARCAARFA
jgi:phosphoenolpyruvate carboxylase